ncbi:GAF domain-containing protein [Archangium violaceum]|uniref:sensor histidine kinase n=1 Tax=Archangium violaceum TaxID=83451 RepID=UPI00194EC3E1|nr:MHYT domain-containing protein [Archangium violaceum]QRN98046.1 GAF domain-containing protein [Archangium violaceum]
MHWGSEILAGNLLGCLRCAGAHIEGAYHPGLVLLSILIAVAASYTALDLAGRVAGTTGMARRVILGSGAAMMGVGIWSMHFVGMLAFRMSMPMSYGPGLTALSMGVAILGAWAALFVVSRSLVTPDRLVTGGIFMGLAICAMHYIGMAAMLMEATLQYDPLLFTLSVLVAIAASLAALWLALRFQREQRAWSWAKLVSALLMGAAISGMHYTGMAAARFVPTPMPPGYVASGFEIGGLGAVAIGVATLAGLALTLLGSLVDIEQRHAQRTLTLLADTSALLGRSLDIPTIAELLAGQVAPEVGDGCLVDLFEEDGSSLRRLAVRYPRHREEEERYRCIRYVLDEHSESPLQKVLRTGQPELFSPLPRGVLERLAGGSECLSLPRDARARALLIVPLMHRERVLGVITVFTRERPLTGPERALVHELGRRAGSAVENARLYHEAQEAIRVRDEFLSIASHELNTPLTPLLMNLQRLQRTVAGGEGTHALTDEQLHRMVDVAQRQTKRLARLVSELLDISRIRLGRLELHREELDLEQVVRGVVGRLGEELAWTGSRPTLHVDGPMVGQWDKARMELVVGNLLANASRYGQGKPVDVSVRGHEGEVCLVVRDRGIGIAPEARKRIFERFERASSRNFGGLGLGLYIVRQIVEAHGGTIGVESELGVGSTFTVKLPRRQTH